MINRGRTHLSEKSLRRVLWAIGAFVVVLLYIVFHRFFDHLLYHLEVAPELGLPLVLRLIEMVHLLFFVMLIISSLTVALSVLYLDKEVHFLVTTPTPHGVIVLERLLITILRASWFVIAGGAPMLLAFSVVSEQSRMVIPVFLSNVAVLMIFVVCPVMLGAIGALLIVRFIPARQAKSALLALSVITLSTTVIGIRWMTPEQFLRPTIDPNVGITLRAIATPASPWLPSGWAARAIVLGENESKAKLLALALATVAAAMGVARFLHMKGLDRIATERMQSAGSGRIANALVAFLPRNIALMAKKEIVLFWRNPTQWSQVIVLFALIIIYVFNFRQFKGEFESRFLRDVISLLNLGMAGFVLVAVANRFVYSSISMEGRAIWILRSSPFDLVHMFTAKLIVGLVPLFVLSEAITILSNEAMDVSTQFKIAAGLIVGLMAITLTSLAIGLGAVAPRFDLKDPAQIGMSPMGILYMGLGLTYVGLSVIVIARYLLRSWYYAAGGLETFLLFGFLILINACAILIPWRLGRNKLDRMELPG